MSDLKNILGPSFNNLLRHLVKESVDETFGPLLHEDERAEQKRTATDLEDVKASPSSDSQDEVEEAEDDEPVEAEEEEEVKLDVEETEPAVLSPEELQEIEVDDFIEQLNQLRSGKSLKDEEVRKQISDYWEKLSASEKKALFSYAQGLSQMVAGGVPGGEAPSPGSYKIRTGEEEVTVSAKEKRVVKKEKGAPSAPSSTVPAGEETPIVVGEVANKSSERRRLRILMRG